MSFICLETSHYSTRSLRSDQQHDSIPFEMVDGLNRFVLRTSIYPPDPNTYLFTDASHFGWRAHLEPMRLSFMVAGRKTNPSSIHHSCMISTDNTTMVSYINKQGGTHSPHLCVEVWEILHWFLEHDIVIRVHHIPSRFNILADRLSRLDKTLKTECALDLSIAYSIFQMLNYPNVDLFVTQFNHNLPLYASPIPDNHALATDAVSMSWNCLHAYAFPPTILILSVLTEIRQSRC